MATTLVTGATRGVGLELSRRLAEAGHTVYLGARDLERGREVAEPIGARAISIDVTDDASVRTAVDHLRQDAGALDVLVNNAGISGTQRPPAEADVNDLQTVLATNVVGATRVLAACTPLLEESPTPVVVNVSSAVGSLTLNAKPDAIWSMVAYPMSKAALNMLTIQYARAFPRWRVNSVTPGLTLTEFTGHPTDSVDLEAFRRAGGRTVDEAVTILVAMATIGPDGPTGTFVGNDGPLPWLRRLRSQPGSRKGVSLGQDLTDADTQRLAGGCATQCGWQISQRVTGSWVAVTEKWLEATLLICLSESRSRSRSAYSLSQETRSAAVAAFSAHRHSRMSEPRRNVPEGRLQ